MIANRMKPVLFAVAFVATFASTASARDRSPDHGNGGPGYYGHHSGHGHHARRGQLKLFSDQRLGGASRASSSTATRPSTPASAGSLASVGVVAGSSIIYSDGFREIYLNPYGAEPQRSASPYIVPKAKVIHVTQELVDGSFRPVNGCSWEMGVCVIRGGN